MWAGGGTGGPGDIPSSCGQPVTAFPPGDSAIGGSHLPLSSRQREMVGLHPGPGSPPRRGVASSTDQGEIAALGGHQGGCVGITNGPSCQVRTLHSQKHFTACQAAHTGLLSQTPRVAGKAPPSLPQGHAPHKPSQAIFKETILNCQRGCSRAPGLLGGLGLRFVFGAASSPYRGGSLWGLHYPPVTLPPTCW